MSLLFAQFPTGTRVTTPGGVNGTVIRVSPALRIGPILVKRDDGRVLAYGPEQLTIVATPTVQSQTRPI
jgi:hypothetical protein